MKCKLLFPLFPLALLAQIQPVRTVTSQAQRVANEAIPGFQNGYLYFVDHAAIRAYSPDGFPVLITVVQIPNEENIWVEGLAVDKDGTFAVGVGYRTAHSAGGIAFYNKYGQPDGFVATGSYIPDSLCFAGDHSLWTFGRRQGSADYMTVRHFSSSRNEVGQYLERSLFPKGLDPGVGSWQRRDITVAQDRVGLFAFSGSNGSLNEWVELDFSGNVMRRVRLDQPEFASLAFTIDGHLYRKLNNRSNLQLLNEATSEWQDAGMAIPGWLLGADGDSLVFSEGSSGPVTMRWFDQPAWPGPSAAAQGQMDLR